VADAIERERMDEPTQDQPPWRREGKRPWYWRSTLSFLTGLSDRSETMESVFRRYMHRRLGHERMALDHLSYLVELGEISSEDTAADAIHTMKQLHKSGNTHDRDWQ
jgi:hypothetical protein